MEKRWIKRKPVYYVGEQTLLDGSSVKLVNDIITHSTIKYDPVKHVIIEKGVKINGK